MATFHDTQTPDLADAASWDGRGPAPGARRTLWALPAALVVALAPYAIPGADDLRIWEPGDAVPFSKHFRTDGIGPGVAEAGARAAAHGTGLGDAERKALAATEELDAPPVDVPALRVEPPQPPRPTSAPPPSTPEGVGEPALAASSAPAGPPPIVVPRETWEGVQVLIEDPGGAMLPFWQALARTARGQDGAVTRISHWGDSAIAADGMTHVARQLLQRQFGDSGHGFALVEAGTDWYKHKGVEIDGAGWKALKIIDKGARDGRYGFGGVAGRGYLGARATIGTASDGPVGQRVGRYDVYYMEGPKRGDLALSVDGAEPTVLHTAGEAVEDRVHSVPVPDGAHELTLRVVGGGPVRVYGVALERDLPGLVYDSLGLVGARGSRLLYADPDHWKRQLALRRPDLMILMYGGNELVDKGMSMKHYRRKFTQLVRRFRESRPEAACLIMSPLDHGERAGGRIRTEPMLLEMMPVQREVALAEGCAWYSIFDAMGGEGSMGRWSRLEPPLGWGDLAHPTKHGARVLGDHFYRAVMKGFADHVARTASAR